MNALKQLIFDARKRRDAAISQAREHYKLTVRDLKQASHKSRTAKPKPRRKKHKGTSNHGGDYTKMTTRQAAELVLVDQGPLTLVELTIEVQRRGCRTGDASRDVAQAIRSALLYHEGQFSRDGEGRWVAP